MTTSLDLPTLVSRSGSWDNVPCHSCLLGSYDRWRFYISWRRDCASRSLGWLLLLQIQGHEWPSRPCTSLTVLWRRRWPLLVALTRIPSPSLMRRYRLQGLWFLQVGIKLELYIGSMLVSGMWFLASFFKWILVPDCRSREFSPLRLLPRSIGSVWVRFAWLGSFEW